MKVHLVTEVFRIIQRPRYPVAAEFVLGMLLISLGVGIILFPGSHIQSTQWLTKTGEALPVAIVAILLGAIKVVCSQKRWVMPGKIAAVVAMGLWLQFAHNTYFATTNHPPTWFLYLCASACSLWIVLTKSPD